MGPPRQRRVTVSLVSALALAVALDLAIVGPSAADPPSRELAARFYPTTTTSIYEHGTDPSTLYRQGCTAGATGSSGVVILDFGRPAERHGTYGTLDFDRRFVTDRSILTATERYADGYGDCLPAGSAAHVIIARGTNNSCSNDDPACCPKRCRFQPRSFFQAGSRWALWTARLGAHIARRGWTAHERASAADDAEPAWDPRFRNTSDFLAGFASRYGYAYPMWDYGSLEPGYWTPDQEWQVAYGFPPDVPFPEIYGEGSAREWMALDLWAAEHEGRPMKIWGVASQSVNGFGCGYTPHRAYDAMLGQLQREANTFQWSIPFITHIPCPAGTARRR